MKFFTKDDKTALEAKGLAQWIAFGPVVFQVARVMRNSGILRILLEKGSGGLTQSEIQEQLQLPEYGLRILLESSLGIGLVIFNEGKYTITKTGTYIYNDPLTNVNMDFIHDVNYMGLFYLDKSIESGKPEGLKVFGNWNSIYEGLSLSQPTFRKAGLRSIITFPTWLFHRLCQRFTIMVSGKYWILEVIPANGRLRVQNL